MHNFPSSILRIGLVNSGMFDLLDLNLDVQAVHLVGQNNVGKTSLISLIQFLYFHDTREMTFPKSLSDSLAFYFRPEGSYILFEVRTLTGAKRTVGIYGEGIAKTRAIFVFDGPFDLTDFMDDSRCVLPLAQAQERFFTRNFYRYPRFEMYEKALLGENPEAGYNVQLFNLSTTNFRLLRKLLQGLLRLDKLTSDDIKNFLISIVETGTVKTKINIAHDFERKNRDILNIQSQLNALRRIEPIIVQWQNLTQRIRDKQAELEEHLERLFHTSNHYLGWLTQQQTLARSQYEAINHQVSQLQQDRDAAVEKRSDYQRKVDDWNKIIQDFIELEHACANQSRVHVEQSRNELIAHKFNLEKTLATVQADNLPRLRSQLQQRQSDQSRLQRQLEQRPLEDLWVEAKFSERERSLLRFLLSEKLIGLPVETAATDSNAFVTASQQALSYLAPDDFFRGFGLAIPATEWYTPLAAMEPLAERLARVEQEIADLQHKITVAEDRARTEAEVMRIGQGIAGYDQLLRQFQELEELTARHVSLSRCRERREAAVDIRDQHTATVQRLDGELKKLRQDEQQGYAELNNIDGQVRSLEREHQQLTIFSTPCPPDIQNLVTADLLTEEYRLAKDRVRRRHNDLSQLDEDIREPRRQLEIRYDQESPDLSFEQWVERKLDITKEIDRLEEQLRQNYNNLLVLVRSELGNLTRAFDAIQLQVTELNKLVRSVSISNIQQIEVDIKESDLVDAIKQTGQLQLDMFSTGRQMSLLMKPGP